MKMHGAKLVRIINCAIAPKQRCAKSDHQRLADDRRAALEREIDACVVRLRRNAPAATRVRS